MDVTPLVPTGRQVVEAYGNGGFRISGVNWTGPVLVFPDRTLAWHGASVDALGPDLFDPVFSGPERPEILLLGCGTVTAALTSGLRQAIRQRGAVVDVMATGAACRTYNVLMSEGRRVAAALIAVD